MDDKIQEILNDEISGRYYTRFDKIAKEHVLGILKNEDFRKKVIEICDEHLGSVVFMSRIREYAGMEIEQRMFTSARYWLTIIATAVVTSGIGFLISKIK